MPQDIVLGGAGRRAYGVRKFRTAQNVLNSLSDVTVDPDAPVGSALVKQADGTFSAGATSGTGDMMASVYDADADGRVEAADTLSDGTNVVTAAQAKAAANALHSHANSALLASLTSGGDGNGYLSNAGTYTAPAGNVVGPATNTANKIPQWNGANSKTLKDGLALITTIGVTGSDTSVPTEQAVREAITAGSSEVAWPQTNLIYLAKRTDSYTADGTMPLPYKTLATALAAAASGDTIVCLDDGEYGAEAGDYDLVAGVSLYAPNATLVGRFDIGANCMLTAKELRRGTGVSGYTIDMREAGTAQVRLQLFTLAGSGNGFHVQYAGAVLLVECGQAYVENGKLMIDQAAGIGHYHYRGADVYITGTGTAFAGNSSVTGVVLVDHVLNRDAGAGRAFYVTGGTIDASVGHIDVTTAYTVDDGATLNLVCGNITGTATVDPAGTAAVNRADDITGVDSAGNSEYVGTDAGGTFGFHVLPAGTGDVVGPASNTDAYVPQWNGADSNTLKDGLAIVTTVGEAGADTSLPTEQAVREAVAAVADSLGTVSSQDSDDVAITGGTITGTDLNTTVAAILTGYNRRKKVLSIIADNTQAPLTEVDGDRYILAADGGVPHAGWDGASVGDIVQFVTDTWVAETPEEGWVVYVDGQDQDALYVDDGTPAWELRSTAITAHNDLSSLDGGTTDEYYHMTSAEHTAVTGHPSSTSNPHSTSIANIGSGTLSQLNSALSDATLDVSSASRTPTAHASTHTNGTDDVATMVGDSGSGGTKGLVPAPSTGDADKALMGDGDFKAVDAEHMDTNVKRVLLEEVLVNTFGDEDVADLYVAERGLSWIYHGPDFTISDVYMTVGSTDGSGNQPTIQLSLNSAGTTILSSVWTVDSSTTPDAHITAFTANTTVTDGDRILVIAAEHASAGTGDAGPLRVTILGTIQ